MNILVIDGQGGKMGRLLIEEILARLPDVKVTAVGTNSVATAAMLKAGAVSGATGENPVSVMAARADVILGPVGIVITDALLGEGNAAHRASGGKIACAEDSAAVQPLRRDSHRNAGNEPERGDSSGG